MLKIALTGADGLVGSQIVELLKADLNVHRLTCVKEINKSI